MDLELDFSRFWNIFHAAAMLSRCLVLCIVVLVLDCAIAWVPVRPMRSTLRPALARLPSVKRSIFLRRVRLSEEEADDDSEDQQSSVSVVEPDMSAIKDGLKQADVNGSDVRVGIIMAKCNAGIVQGLYKGVNESLVACGVKPSNVFTTQVPGAFELPVTARLLAASKRVDVIVNLACIIEGETMRSGHVADAVANGLMQVSLDTMVPCIYGVLSAPSQQHADAHSSGDTNEGLAWGRAAVEMGLHRMAALGMDMKSSQQGADSTAPFVAFRGPLPGVTDGKNATKVGRKIGF